MSNRRLKSPKEFTPSKKQKPSVEQANRMTTYNQPTKGVKFTGYELELIEKSVVALRDSTGSNITFSKVMRALSYFLEEEETISKLSDVIKSRIH